MIITRVIDTVFNVGDQLKIEMVINLVQDKNGNKCIPNMSLYKDWNENINEVTGTLYRKVLYSMRLVGPNGFNNTFSLRSKGMSLNGGDLYRIARYGEKILDRIYDENDDFAITRRDKAIYDSLHNEDVYTDIRGSFDPNDRILYEKKANAFSPRLELSNFAVIETGFRLYPMERNFPTPLAKNVVGIEMRISPEMLPHCAPLGFEPFPILTEFEMSELVDFCKKFDPSTYASSVANTLSTNAIGWLSKHEFRDRTRVLTNYDDVICNDNQSIKPKQTVRPDTNIQREMALFK